MHLDHSTFDENAETLDANITHIRQAAAFLGYAKAQVLEVFQENTPNEIVLSTFFP